MFKARFRLRKLRRLALIAGALPGLYVLVYLLLSAFGHYRPISVGGLGHWETYLAWAPAGFYDPYHSAPGSAAAERGIVTGTWRGSMITAFYPLWIVDMSYVHRSR